MGQVLGADRNGGLTKISNTVVQMNLSSLSDIKATILGQQYQSLVVLQMNGATIGAGGLDIGSLAASSIYYVHTVLNGSALAIIASLSKTAPTGFSVFQFTGLVFVTNASAQISTVSSGTLRFPTQTLLTSGSGSYSAPSGCLYLHIRMVGGGGGGASGQSSGTGGNGGTTTFGTSLLTTTGGGGGITGDNGGGGGSATINSPAYGTALTGGNGSSPGLTSTGGEVSGGSGGFSPFGGAGRGGAGHGTPGLAAASNTGSGGGGGGSATSGAAGSGGGASGFVDAIVPNPGNAVYAWTIGAGGSAGSGTNNGGAGGSGYIEITEIFQ